MRCLGHIFKISNIINVIGSINKQERNLRKEVVVVKRLTGAMQLDGREGELLGDVRVLDACGLVETLALDPLGGQRGRRDGRAAAERLELGLHDLAVLVDLDLELHDVAAGGRAHHARAHVRLLRVQLAHVARVLVVVDDLIRVGVITTRSRENIPRLRATSKIDFFAEEETFY